MGAIEWLETEFLKLSLHICLLFNPTIQLERVEPTECQRQNTAQMPTYLRGSHP